MADNVTPSQVRARRFGAARRGYDRAEVEQYLASVADEIERLRSKLESRPGKLLAVGLDDPEALALELDIIGGEVATILEAARAAADGMRTRAASDVEHWRATTETEVSELVRDASEQSHSMRASAWNEGSSMLSASVAEANQHLDSAKEDALFIRAEAERQALRLTGDAKRDREESLRAARIEAEQILETSKAESAGILDAASRQAEQAQERARALEDRRSELLAELESTRESIGQLETEIESKRQELETPVAVSEHDLGGLSHQVVDGGSVRIVTPSKTVPLEPVDAEEFVAEVKALRSSTTVVRAAEPVVVTTETIAVIAPPPSPEPAVAPPVSEPPRLVEVREAPAESSPSDGGDEIGSLFAELRAATETVKNEGQHGSTGTSLSEKEETSTEDDPAQGDQADDEGSASLIPLQNAALKVIKRTLVDLQSDALENLRIDDAWEPAKLFTNRFKAPYAELASGITGSKNDQGAAASFSSDLHAAISSAVGRARESGAGERQIASDVSRVFRMWRADEAERRVIDTAQKLSAGG